MVAVRIVAICVAAAALCAVLRSQHPEMAMALAVVAGLVALGLSMDALSRAANTLSTLAAQSGLSAESTQLLIRATGIALLAEFGAQLCRDAGESSLAGRIEMGGRMVLLGMATPLLSSLMDRLLTILP